MATNQNNIHTNSFTKGMNTDTSLDMVSNELYVFGLNIRITNNALLNAIINSNTTEGIVSPVPEGIPVYTLDIYEGTYKILATASIENIGAIIIADDNKWYIYRLDLCEPLPNTKNEIIKFSKLFEAPVEEGLSKKFSVVINKEINDVVKLYIADGKNPLMQINIADNTGYNLKISGNVDNLISNWIYLPNKVQILKQISGNLKTQQVLYTYRFYKKYGVSSKLAPVTNKILIINSNKNKEEGCAEDTETSIGLLIQIPIKEVTVNNIKITDIYDHIQIYRLSYIKAQSDAEVTLIYDSAIKSDEDVTINDTGIKSIQDLSIEEFAALNELTIIPQNIEQNLNYMFAANVDDKTVLRIDDIDSKAYSENKDGKVILYPDTLYAESPIEGIPTDDQKDTYYLNRYSDMNMSDDEIESVDWKCKYTTIDDLKYYGGSGDTVSWRFVTCPITIHGKFNMFNSAPSYPTKEEDPKTILFSYLKQEGDKIVEENIQYTAYDYLLDHGITACESVEYDDIIGSSMFRSLRRDEVYRYGIVYYDKYGRRSDVQWISDIHTPSQKEYSSFDGTYEQGGDDSSHVEETTITMLASLSMKPTFINPIVVTTAKSEIHQSVEQKNRTIHYEIGNIVISEIVNDVTTTYSYGEYVKKHPKFNLIITASINDVSLAPNQQKYLSQAAIFKSAIAISADREEYSDYTTVGVLVTIRKISLINNTDDNLAYPNSLYAKPIGIKFDIDIPKDKGITSYQIVRCSKQPQYSRCLMQCAMARPMRQIYATSTNSGLTSPWYPSPFLTTQSLSTLSYIPGLVSTSISNKTLFLLFSPEILLYSSDSCDLLSKTDSSVNAIGYAYQSTLLDMSYAYCGHKNNRAGLFNVENNYINYNRWLFDGSGLIQGDAATFKSGSTCNTYLYNIIPYFYKYNDTSGKEEFTHTKFAIENISETLNPTWENGFSNVQLSGSEVLGAVKAYKSYVTSIKNDEYVNWVANGMYDLRVSAKESQAGYDNDDEGRLTHVFTYTTVNDGHQGPRNAVSSGWIGPGPKCLLAKLETVKEEQKNDGSYKIKKTALTELLSSPVGDKDVFTLGSIICNITHPAEQFAGLTKEQKQFDVYYGFGNFGKLHKEGDRMVGSIVVMDGEIYNMPCEFVSMFKTYNFNSLDTLPSAQTISYIPLETKINVFFDYGMNYRNTQSPNLQLEPGLITGVCTQDRPLNQYNSVYSDNNTSNDVFNTQQLEESVDQYNQRIYYSELKTNGENIDSWMNYKALNYIDADTRYGEITNLLTVKDILYFWLTSAFGKLSVNERSLVTDNNSNTIQLGQGGVLQRTDYIDTVHGMRKYDHSAVNADNVVFWIDILNKAILCNTQGVVNYGERTNVLNQLNKCMSEDIPTINYDIQSDELICKCLTNGDLIVFNIKGNCATSVYTRRYEDAILFNNTIYGITSDNKFVKFNNITDKQFNNALLAPVKLSFVANESASINKVFDNQKIVILEHKFDNDFAKNFMTTKVIKFTTNLDDSAYESSTDELITDREGNIQYCIPRANNAMYGNRLRGKWMRVDITDYNPSTDFTISHVLTQFRLSFI